MVHLVIACRAVGGGSAEAVALLRTLLQVLHSCLEFRSSFDARFVDCDAHFGGIR